jgi:hypothetical protein
MIQMTPQMRMIVSGKDCYKCVVCWYVVCGMVVCLLYNCRLESCQTPLQCSEKSRSLTMSGIFNVNKMVGNVWLCCRVRNKGDNQNGDMQNEDILQHTEDSDIQEGDDEVWDAKRTMKRIRR